MNLNHLVQSAENPSAGALALGINLLVQSTVLLTVGLLAASRVRKRSAAVESVVLRTLLVAVLVCPAVSWLMQRAGFNGLRVTLPIANHLTTLSQAEPAQTIAAVGWLAHHAPTIVIWTVVLLSVLLLARLGVAMWLLRRVRWEAQSASCNWIEDAARCARAIGVAAPPVLLTDYFDTPCLIACASPAILLPRGSQSVRREVLVHELAHVRRQDCLWHLLARAATALFWFQPLMWVLARRLEQSADEACDDFVVSYGSDRTDYARQLVDMAERHQLSRTASACAMGMAAMKSVVGRRVIRIMDSSRGVSTHSRGGTLVMVTLFFTCGTLLAAMLGANVPALAVEAAPAAASQRLAVPDAAAQVKAEKLIRDVYGNYSALPPADRAAAAAKMLDEGNQTQDNPAARYLLIKHATDLAAAAGDAATALAAIDANAKVFDVDPDELRLEALRKAASTASSPAAAKTVADAGLACANDAVTAGNYDLAMKFIAPTEAAARRSTPALASLQTRISEIRWMQSEAGRAKLAEEKLAKAADDAEARLTLGRFRCLIRMDWKHGLPELMRGSSPGYRAAAAADIANPNHYDKQVATGDLWWDLGEKEQNGAQTALRQRAVYWYSQATSDTQFAGLTRARVEKRVSSVPAAAMTSTEVVSVPSEPAVPAPAPAKPPAEKPAPAGGIFADSAAGRSGRKNVLMFLRDNGKAQVIFKQIGGNNFHAVKPADMAAMLANPQAFSQSNIIVWEPNAYCDAPPEVITAAVVEKLHRFVENGGDLVVFEQFRDEHWDLVENAFGIKRFKGGPYTLGDIDAALSAKLGAAGITAEDIAKIRYATGAEMPENTTVLVRSVNNAILVGALPVGKGKVIFCGASFSGQDDAFNEVVLDYMYHFKKGSTAVATKPPPARASGDIDLLQLVDLSKDTIEGNWTRGSDGITSPHDPHGLRIRFPYDVPAEYDLHVSFTVHENHGMLGVIVAHNDASALWAINYPGDCRFVAHQLPEKIVSLTQGTFAAGSTHHVLVKVRNDAMSTFLDDKAMGEVSEDYSQSRLDNYWSIGNHSVGIASGAGSVTFQSIKLVEVTGHGKSLPRSENHAAALAMGAEKSKALADLLNDPAHWVAKAGTWKNTRGKLHGEGDCEVDFDTVLPPGIALSFHFRQIKGAHPRMDFAGTDMMLGNRGDIEGLFPHDFRISPATSSRIGLSLNDGKTHLLTFKLWSDHGEIEVDGKPTFAGTYKPAKEIRLLITGGTAADPGICEFSDFHIQPLPSADASR